MTKDELLSGRPGPLRPQIGEGPTTRRGYVALRLDYAAACRRANLRGMLAGSVEDARRLRLAGPDQMRLP